MDTSDPDIVFDGSGICNHCTNFIIRLQGRGYVKNDSEALFQKYVDAVKDYGKGKPYDCIVGISGGVDSC